ncbi:MAG: DUF4136 domain-containing protein [Gammaproteobacteria bacterium]|nr:DUF4136 domain-containing protein [Gammaproteobacteria bacterium]
MRIINIIFISLMLSACASMVNVDYDRSTDFSSYKTYNIDSKPVRIFADTRINSSFMQQRVVNELNATLTKNGFKNIDKNADFNIKYFLDIRREVGSQDSGGFSIGFGSASRHSAIGLGFNIPIRETTSIDYLVLTIDIVSTKTNKLLWRGSLGYSLYEGASPETYTKLVSELVEEILQNFPPK